MNFLMCLDLPKQSSEAAAAREQPRVMGNALFRIDRKRMDDALASESFDVPQGLSVEEIRQHIIATAKSSA